MTTHEAAFGYTTGQTLTAQLFAEDSDTAAFTADSVTEETNKEGIYVASFTNVTAGKYRLVYFLGGTGSGYEWFKFTGTDSERQQPWADFGNGVADLIANSVWDEVITGAEHNVNNSAAKFVREASEATIGTTGTLQSATSTTAVLASGAVTVDDYFNGERLSIIEGTGAGQSRLITDSTASSDTVTLGHAWTTNPDNTSVYAITGAEVDIRAVAEQAVTATATVDFDKLATLGSGARQVVVTVDDGSDPLQNVEVNVYNASGASLGYRGQTNSSGQVTFQLDDATYKFGVSSVVGYNPHTPETLIVDGSPDPETITLSLTATSVSEPSDPSLATLVVKCVDETGAVEQGVTVEAKIVTIPSGSTGLAFDQTTQEATSGSDGNAYLTVVRSATYDVRRGTAKTWERVTIANAASTTITSFIGSP